MIDHWQEVRLGEIGEFRKGRGIAKIDLAESGIRCLRYGEIYTAYSDVVHDLKSFVPPHISSKALPIHSGDIIFAASGETREEIGKAIAWLGRVPAVAGSDTIVLRGHSQDASYLAYALNSENAIRQKMRLGKGHAVVHIHVAELSSITVPLPPVSEQRKIAKILRTWDEEIEVIDALRAAWISQKQGLMQALLTGRHRFTEFKNQPWRTFPLGDCAALNKKVAAPQNFGEMPYVGLEHIDERGLLRSGDSSEVSSEKMLFKRGDILFGKLRPYLVVPEVFITS